MRSITIGLVFNIFDLISGIFVAIKQKDLQSCKLRDGIFKKFGFIFCYVLAYLIDNFGEEIGFKLSVSILPAVIAYVVFTEVISIIENITKLNPDLLPEKLKELFHVG